MVLSRCLLAPAHAGSLAVAVRPAQTRGRGAPSMSTEGQQRETHNSQSGRWRMWGEASPRHRGVDEIPLALSKSSSNSLRLKTDLQRNGQGQAHISGSPSQQDPKFGHVSNSGKAKTSSVSSVQIGSVSVADPAKLQASTGKPSNCKPGWGKADRRH